MIDAGADLDTCRESHVGGHRIAHLARRSACARLRGRAPGVADRPNGRDDRSFPSRHTAASFAAAQYLQTRGGWEYGLPAYAAAALVGYSRVRAHEHYWKDVAAGAGIGIASGYFFTDPRERTRVSVIAGPKAAHLQLTAFW
ncbi:phosphatase PAP2 family protein [Aromatoleum toluvorans]|uniref:Phosphatase PAP2 family protein n=1 Tax=Aromatoleum toluvorans TaxID=92002 RepID=A0ABX1Q496_9RHOO|nr:phosphatase PAP2 family protein [Aromatoleum toluvorans]